MADPKSIHTLVLDAGPLIKNVPSVSSLIASSTTLVTHPSVIGEIRDAATRSRLETTLRPFLALREPKPESVKFIQDFAKKSGDLEVLSRPDILLLALTYEVECERNGGDWRLRKVPGQKGLNGKPPARTADQSQQKAEDTAREDSEQAEDKSTATQDLKTVQHDPATNAETGGVDVVGSTEQQPVAVEKHTEAEAMSEASQNTHLPSNSLPEPKSPGKGAPAQTSLPTPPHSSSSESEGGSDNEGWITPSNLRRHQAEDANPSKNALPQHTTLQSALITTDHAMQNVALLMNLNLMSTSLTRITQLRTYTQRCHACFFVFRPSDKSSPSSGALPNASSTTKHFCPRCGLPTLTRVSCSTSAATGEFKVHLKANMQWNNRGTRFSVPKPTAGAANGRQTGGGKGGWGNELLLTEDQKEYTRAVSHQERQKRRDAKLLDDDLYDFGLNAGGRAGGRIQVGAGRDVNSRRRRK